MCKTEGLDKSHSATHPHTHTHSHTTKQRLSHLQHTLTTLMVLCFSSSNRNLYRLKRLSHSVAHLTHEALPGGHHTFASISLPGQTSMAPFSVPHPLSFQLPVPSWLLCSVHYSSVTHSWLMSLFVQNSPSLYTLSSSNYQWHPFSKVSQFGR